jgi:hypothetical protein
MAPRQKRAALGRKIDERWQTFFKLDFAENMGQKVDSLLFDLKILQMRYFEGLSKKSRQLLYLLNVVSQMPRSNRILRRSNRHKLRIPTDLP